MKRYKLDPSELKPLVEGMGACFASDRITVDGARVGFMYRENPENETDSGWRFLAGDEDEDYIDDTDNTGIYDLNTIANCDPSIVSLLKTPVGHAFQRDEKTGKFVEVPMEPDVDETEPEE